MIKKLFVIVILIFVSNYSYSATIQCYNCSNCTSAIQGASDDDVIQLMNSVEVDGTCINWGGGSNITFDCINFQNYIKGNTSGLGINGGGDSIIKNCNISNFYFGVALFDVQFATLDNLLINENYIGIRFQQSSNNTITNCNIKNNTWRNIYFYENGIYSQNNTFNDNYLGNSSKIRTSTGNWTNFNNLFSGNIYTDNFDGNFGDEVIDDNPIWESNIGFYLDIERNTFSFSRSMLFPLILLVGGLFLS